LEDAGTYPCFVPDHYASTHDECDSVASPNWKKGEAMIEWTELKDKSRSFRLYESGPYGPEISVAFGMVGFSR
jgi:hypothetical protein